MNGARAIPIVNLPSEFPLFFQTSNGLKIGKSGKKKKKLACFLSRFYMEKQYST